MHILLLKYYEDPITGSEEGAHRGSLTREDDTMAQFVVSKG